jgi:hypothetical protein
MLQAAELRYGADFAVCARILRLLASGRSLFVQAKIYPVIVVISPSKSFAVSASEM